MEGQLRKEGGESDRRRLWVAIDIEVGRKCPLVGLDRQIQDVSTQQMGGICRSEAIVDDDDGVAIRHMETNVREGCVADVFFEHDCVPRVSTVRDDSVIVTAHPSNRAKISDIVGGLREAGYDAHVERIVNIDDNFQGLPTVLCDFSSLTEKQTEALALAVKRGYYAQPREANLEELAAHLDIGKSALSQRLKSAEAKIIRNHLPWTEED